MTTQATNFIVVAAFKVDMFTEKVNARLKEGYALYGPMQLENVVAITDNDSKDLYESDPRFVQAMIKQG